MPLSARAELSASYRYLPRAHRCSRLLHSSWCSATLVSMPGCVPNAKIGVRRFRPLASVQITVEESVTSTMAVRGMARLWRYPCTTSSP